MKRMCHKWRQAATFDSLSLVMVAKANPGRHSIGLTRLEDIYSLKGAPAKDLRLICAWLLDTDGLEYEHGWIIRTPCFWRTI